MKTFYVLAASALLGLSLLSVPSLAGTPADTLVIARNTDDTLTFDPHAAYETSPSDVIRNTYRRLFTLDPKTHDTLVGDIADTWVFSEDGQTLTVKLKSGLTFASGSPVTSDDVVYSLRRAIKLHKTPSYILEGLGWTKDTVDAQVRAGAAGEVILTLGTRLASGYVLGVLSTSVSAIVDQKEVTAHETNGDLGFAWLSAHSAGAGAYQLLDWKPREVVLLQASKHYAGPPPKLTRIIIRHVPDAGAQRLLLESGDVDVASNLTSDQLAVVSASPKLRVQSDPNATVYYVGLNLANPDLAKPQVWQALRYLVDYNGIADHLLKGQVIVNQGLIGHGLPAGLPDTPFTYDPVKAKALLADAGYTNGLAITLDAPTAQPYFDIAQSVQQSFAAGGVKVTLRSADIKEVLTRYRSRKEEAVVFSFVPDFVDPNATLDFFLRNPDNSDSSPKKSAAWRLNWQSPELTKAVSDELGDLDATHRLSRYREIQEQVRASSPLLLSFQAQQTVGLSRRIKGYFAPSPTEFVNFAGVVKTP